MADENTTASDEQKAPATLDDIDANAPVAEREAQARKILLQMSSPVEPDIEIDESGDSESADESHATTDDDEKPKKQGKGPSLAERERKLKALERKLSKQQKELESSIEKLKSSDPIEQLKAAGHDTGSLIDRLVKGEPKKTDKTAELEKQLIELQSQIRRKEQETAYNAAINEISSKIDEDTHTYLGAEDNPPALVLQYITAEYENNGNELTVEEALDTLEAYYADKFARIESKRAKKKQPEGKKPNNPPSRGGSASKKSWEDLSVQERLALETKRLNALARG